MAAGGAAVPHHSRRRTLKFIGADIILPPDWPSPRIRPHAQQGRSGMTTPRQLLLGLLTGVGLCFTPHASAEDSPTPVVPSDVKSAVGTTLVELLSVAEASSPTLRQFAIEIESTRGKARQAGLYPNPVASGGATQIAGPQSQ